MMGFLMLAYDHKWDALRVFNMVIGVLCVVWSIGGYRRQHETWNDKSMGLWYSRLIWSVTIVVLSLEGLQRGTGWTYTLGFVTVSGLSSFAALHRRGTWGHEARTQEQNQG